MSIERIRNAIIAEADKEAERLRAGAKEDAQSRMERGRHDIDTEMQRRYESAEKALKQDVQRRVMQQRARYNLELLEKRNEILRAVFDRAVGHFQTMDDRQYLDVLRTWTGQIPSDTAGRIACSGGGVERIQPLVDAMNEQRDARCQLSVEPDEELESGIMFRSDRFEIDLSVRSKLEELREELVPDIARVVFTDSVKL